MRILKWLQVSALAVIAVFTATSCAAIAALAHGDVGGAINAAAMTVAELSAAVIEDVAKGKVPKEFTPENEYFIGRGVSAAIVDKYPSTDMSKPTTQNQIAYLNQMGSYINAASGEIDKLKLGNHVSRDDDEKGRLQRFTLHKDVHVGILESNEVMAYSTPGGFIWISRGTIAMCENEDQLAAVIAHELGHVVMNHGMDAYRKATEGKITDSAVFKKVESNLGPVVGNFAQMVGGFADNLVQNGYGKDQEFEADNFGTRALGEAGFDPKNMVTMLKRLEAYEKAKGDKEGNFAKNHPEPEERIEEIEKILKDSKSGVKKPTSDPGKAAREKRFKEVWGR
jgi:predicted Zn-dependent protease